MRREGFRVSSQNDYETCLWNKGRAEFIVDLKASNYKMCDLKGGTKCYRIQNVEKKSVTV